MDDPGNRAEATATAQNLMSRFLADTGAPSARKRPIFSLYRRFKSAALDQLQLRIGATLCADLKLWLLTAGFGDIADTLSLRAEWLHVVERGQLAGAVLFAQDDLGNFYGIGPEDGGVCFVDRHRRRCDAFAKFLRLSGRTRAARLPVEGMDR